MEESELLLDPSVLEQTNEAYSSLTDLNKIPVFTNTFQETIAAVQDQQEEKQSFLQKQAFTNVIRSDEGDANLTAILFQGTSMQRIKEEEMQRTGMEFIYPILMIVAAVFIVWICWYWNKREQKRTQKTKEIEETFIME